MTQGIKQIDSITKFNKNHFTLIRKVDETQNNIVTFIKRNKVKHNEEILITFGKML